MKTLRTILISLSMIFAVAGSLRAAPTGMDILEKMDEVERLGEDITVKIVLTETRVDQGVKVHEGVYYRRDRDDAYLIIITAPESAKGNGYLRVGDAMWMYRRHTRTFQMMARGQKIEGSDADASDLETRKYSDLYEPALDEQGDELVSEETLGKAEIPVYRMEVNAKVRDVDYPKKVYWVRQDNFLKLKEASYALSGTLAQTSYFPQYTQIEGRYVPAKQLFIDEFEGDKTLVELSGISLKPIDDHVFTKAYLESLSK